MPRVTVDPSAKYDSISGLTPEAKEQLIKRDNLQRNGNDLVSEINKLRRDPSPAQLDSVIQALLKFNMGADLPLLNIAPANKTKK